MIKKFIWAVIKLGKRFLEELLKGWFKRKLLTVMLYAGAIIIVLLLLAALASVL